MFTPIKVPKDIKNGELGNEMFDDIAEDNTGNTSLDNINMTVTNILHSDALNCDSVEVNSQLLHACRNLNTKFDDNILNTPSSKTILGTHQVYVKVKNRLKTIHQYLNHKYQNQRGEGVDLIKKPLKVSYSTQFH